MTPERKAECHPDRKHEAKGLCAACYQRSLPREAPSIRVKDRKPSCHPDRKHEAKGLCNACYQRGRPKRAGRVIRLRERETSKNYKLSLRYSVSLDQYKTLLVSQNGMCAICGRPESLPGRKLSVDHCHITKVVRGLLCARCNTGLGYFRDSEESLRAAASYLRDLGRVAT